MKRSPSKYRLSHGPQRPRAIGARSDSAFTLVEIMFAAMASAIIFAALYGVFSSAVHLRNNADLSSQIARMRMRAESTIRKDLQNAIISGGVMAATLNGTQQSHSSQFPGYLQFTTTTAEVSDNDIGGDIQAVEYYIAKDADGSNHTSGVLVRTENRVILAPTQITPPEEPILSYVSSLDVSFFDGSSWTNTWAVQQPGDPLPQAVRVTVTQTPPDGSTRPPLEILVPWRTQPAISTTTTTTTGGTTPAGGAGT